MWMIVWYLPYLMEIEEDLDRSADFFRIFDYTPSISNFEGVEIPEKKIKGSIKFENVSFNYPTKP